MINRQGINAALCEYFRLPVRYACLALRQSDNTERGYFRFGEGAVCYGSAAGAKPEPSPREDLRDLLQDVALENGNVLLSFNPSEVAGNLRRELYVGSWRQGPSSPIADIYYLLRPFFPIAVRRRLQSLYLRGWNQIPFPHWPIDCSVDDLLQQLLLLLLKASGADRIPFIWFWPEGRSSCAIMTHDVETRVGSDFCPTLMDIDDSFGIKASFQIIPEDRYLVRPEFLLSIHQRGFEIAVHDLNHDGHLYRNRKQFLERAARINSYGKQFGAKGFRAAVLYRKQLWYDALEFSFDMSVPNVAHLDPQRGGCCTVMPYFLNQILEIPVTMVQDYTLFNVLRDYSINLWIRQMRVIIEKHGCMNFIVHPDYLTSPRELRIYRELLTYLGQLRQERNVWITTPCEVNAWWRQRAAMGLVEDGDGWQITGANSERARIAFAREENGRLVISLAESCQEALLPGV